MASPIDDQTLIQTMKHDGHVREDVSAPGFGQRYAPSTEAAQSAEPAASLQAIPESAFAILSHLQSINSTGAYSKSVGALEEDLMVLYGAKKNDDGKNYEMKLVEVAAPKKAAKKDDDDSSTSSSSSSSSSSSRSSCTDSSDDDSDEEEKPKVVVKKVVSASGFGERYRPSTEAAQSAEPAASLQTIPEGLLQNVLRYLDGDDDFLTTILSLHAACRTLHKAMKVVPRWESGKNIVIDCVGGADAVRKVIQRYFWGRQYRRRTIFRGDSIAYMTHMAQNQVVALLTRARAAAKHRGETAYPPEITSDDLSLVCVMVGDFLPDQDISPDEACLNLADPQNDARKSLARNLAFQVGAKIRNDGLVDRIWVEVWNCIFTLAYDSAEHYHGYGPWVRWRKGIDFKEFNELRSEFGDLRMRYPPPLDMVAGTPAIVVPGQLKQVAKWRGMKPLMGYDELGYNEWATGCGRTRTKEIEEAINQYKASNLFKEGEWVGESMTAACCESDGDYADMMESESDSEGSQHELDSSFFEDY